MATPTQSSRGVQDPRKVFGFGKQTYSDYFGVPKGAAFDPSFSPAARESLLEDELITRERDALQKDLAAQDEAETLLDEAPALNDRQLQRRLLQNPRLMGTPQFKNLDEFLTRRQEVRKPNPKSDEVLAPAFAEKITDPRRKAEFQSRIVQDGLSFEEARDLYYQDDFNEKQAIQLAEAGVPETEYESLRRNGTFDPASVARRVAQAKREQMAPRRSNNPLDQQIDLLREAIRTRTSVLNATGEDPAADPELNNWSRMANDLYGRRLKEFAPDGTPVTTPAPGAPVPVVPGAPGSPPQADRPLTEEEEFIRDITEGKTPETRARERQQMLAKEEQQKAVSPVQEEIARTWTQQKNDLQKELEKRYPNKLDLLLAARAVAADAMEETDTPIEEAKGRRWDPGQRVPYDVYLLNKIGRNSVMPAFKEPRNERWGTQEVTNQELIREWANDILRKENIVGAVNPEQSATAVPPQTELQAKADEIAKRLLNQK